MTAENVKEKRRSYHQYPTETFEDSRLNQFIPPALPNNFISPALPNNFSQPALPNNFTQPALPNSFSPTSFHDRNGSTFKNNSSDANLRKISDAKKDIRSAAILEDNSIPLKSNAATERKINELKKAATQDQFDSTRRTSLITKLSNTDNERLSHTNNPERVAAKRLSGNFKENELTKIMKTSHMDLNKRFVDQERESAKSQPTSKPKPVGHSKLTKTEERYIADLLNAKMCFPEKVKSKAPEKPSQDDLEEERKKGAIRKRPPPLQEPASRPQSSFIMDDVLYTTR